MSHIKAKTVSRTSLEHSNHLVDYLLELHNGNFNIINIEVLYEKSLLNEEYLDLINNLEGSYKDLLDLTNTKDNLYIKFKSSNNRSLYLSNSNIAFDL